MPAICYAHAKTFYTSVIVDAARWVAAMFAPHAAPLLICAFVYTLRGLLLTFVSTDIVFFFFFFLQRAAFKSRVPYVAPPYLCQLMLR